jgi:S-adenosyl-L-methionine hydrolase (adenosine-forming)
MIVTLTTDFGTADHYVGVMKGVLLASAPQLQVVDLTHEVEPGRVEAGAFALLASYRYFPAGTVHVGVVDPGVGSQRRALLVDAAAQYFVGPDNGLFSYVLEREPTAQVVEVTDERYFRQPRSDTFHGRDVFAPLAAALASGVKPYELGPILTQPVRLPPLRPQLLASGALMGRILHVDRFGNCVTSLTPGDLPRAGTHLRLTAGDCLITELRRHYSGAAPGAPFAIWGSSGFLELSVNGGSAADLLGIAPGAAVEVPAGTSDRRTEESG